MLSAKVSKFTPGLLAGMLLLMIASVPVIAATPKDATSSQAAPNPFEAQSQSTQFNAARLEPAQATATRPEALIHVAIDGVPGDLVAPDAGQIAALSFQQGVSNTVASSNGGGGGAGKASFSNVVFTHLVDKTSPKLMTLAASGQHIKQAVITFRQAGNQNVFYQVTLSDVVLTQVQQATNPALMPVEEVSMSFTKIHWTYFNDDQPPTQVDGGWDLLKNSSN